MERERKLQDHLLTIFATILCLLGVSGCSEEYPEGQLRVATDIFFSAGTPLSRAADPDEDKVSDINVFVFSPDGFLEKSEYLSGETRCSFSLVEGREYDIYACANFGYKLKIRSLEELLAAEFYLVYPDDYSLGVPMCAVKRGVKAGKSVKMELERLMAKVSVSIDRNRLSEGVTMNVVGMRVGNCPKKAKVFSPSAVESSRDCFSKGFERGRDECEVLNRSLSGGVSQEVSLYVLENLQGDFPGEISSDAEKTLDSLEVASERCTFVEMDLEYSSPYFYTSEGYLKYRFYLGESRSDLNVERNCHYHITVTPENDGLSDDGWRVSKEALRSEVSFSMTPSGYLEARVGETVHVRCSFTPPGAPFDIGLEELEEDRKTGIYDYVIDSDGFGVTLTLKNPGAGMLYMEVGDPVNQAGILYLQVKE